MMITEKKISLFALIAMIGLFFTACNSDDDDDVDEDATVAQIMTLDPEGDAVPRAHVLMTCESSVNRPCDIEVKGQTDESGIFQWKTDLPKVLRVRAHKIIFDTTIEGTLPDTSMTVSRDSICGETYISILEGETSRQTVVLFECN